MKFLVTGGAGFIGSNFVRYALHKNHEVINLDKLTYAGNIDNLKDMESNGNYRFIRGDIASRGLVEKIFTEEIDAVVNFAAESHVDRSIKNPSVFIKTNVLGVQVLLDAALKFKVRFIQISTDEVYGSLGEKGHFTEATALSPNNPYAASKAAADLLAGSYFNTYGLPVNITRCSNNYGPFQYTEKLIPLVITNALQDIPIPIYGDGHYIRDWLHVEDHCRAIEAVLLKGRPGEVYNIGGHNEIMNIDLVNRILKMLNKSSGLVKFVQDRPGHDRRYAIDAAKIQAELDWRPAINFEQGLAGTVQWYVNNPCWWKKLNHKN